MTGKTLSHYEILGELGRGGMGIVTKSVSQDRKVWIEFNFVERLMEIVPPIE